MLRRLLTAFLALLLGLTAVAADARWAQVDVDPTRTSIYVGSVAMTMASFARRGQSYSAAYTAKVFPFFFYNEQGTLTVDVSDEQLGALAQGKTIEFAGTATSTGGGLRKVTAKAIPADPRSGRLDVHVFVSKRIQLIFHTKYRFHGE